MLLLVAGIAASLLHAGAPTRSRLTFRTAPESRVSVMGSATIGAWKCETSEIDARIEPGPRLEALTRRVLEGQVAEGEIVGCVFKAEAAEGGAPFARISIPVASLRSDKPGMRADIQRALRAATASNITFVLSEIRGITVEARQARELGRYRVTVRGDLALAGRTRTIDLTAEVVQETPARFRLVAAVEIQMADFEIVPPTALFGLIRADGTVVVEFDLKLSVSNPGSV
jgi:hypothetical protein